MSWIAVAVGTGFAGAATKYMDAKQQQKQEQAKLMANAAQIQYSPWTHANAQIMGATAGSPTAAAIGGAMQGGIAGLAMGQANGGFGSKGAAVQPDGSGMNGALTMNDYQTQSPGGFGQPMGSSFGKKNTLYGNMA